jgi:hypothetical protein
VDYGNVNRLHPFKITRPFHLPLSLSLSLFLYIYIHIIYTHTYLNRYYLKIVHSFSLSAPRIVSWLAPSDVVNRYQPKAFRLRPDPFGGPSAPPARSALLLRYRSVLHMPTLDTHISRASNFLKR